jgi:integrase
MASIHATKQDAHGKPERGTRWKVRYRDAHGRTRSRTFDRKLDAERFAERNGSELQRGDWIDPRSSSIRFATVAERWWATTVKLAPTTRRGYDQLLRNHVLPEFGNRTQGSITWVDVEEFIANKLAAGHNPKRVRDMVSVTSLVMKTAIKARLRTDNPAHEHDIPMRQRRLEYGEVLTMEQVHQLVEATRDPYKPLVWLFVMAGLRPAELCGLRVRSVDFGRRTMHVTETLNVVNKFADHAHAIHRGPTKTPAGDRFVPLSATLCDELAQMLAVRADERGWPIDRSEPLFESIRGDKPLTPVAIRRFILRPALAAIGLTETFRTYDLRHTHASLLIEDGASPLDIAYRMGHTDGTLTMKVYGHLFEGAQERLTDRLEEMRQRSAAPTHEVASLDERRRSTGTSGSSRG